MKHIQKSFIVFLVALFTGCQTLPAAVIPISASASVEIIEAPAQIACGPKDLLHQYTITIGGNGADYFALKNCSPQECMGQAKITDITFQRTEDRESEGFWLSLNHQFEMVADIELAVAGKVHHSKVTHQFRSSAIVDYICRNVAYQMPRLKQKIDKELKNAVLQYTLL
ncbi:hypothetical protein [Pseudoalteromonas tunicata]|jgi:hypothetical protein|uniref:Orphan protein n=1 Tax=Pseudoalteromonas tunicata D2 TaxID=87626 RepID=A4C3I1_9GAMM|nr:hypothetical protein [Pseudoalteromonas tunicata]ATC96604.1 hypothetical protein PTUN_b0157 [Pseudoalteromonas tunicata]AXT32787.1 hypothetical protein D1819_18205 [Pseudoalteromonas tunicata]EAR30113.1 hypothetical protein PTD2_01051 [Pseudoalteromonas tunicata D2]